jgi:hypothetical protein
MIEDNFEIFMFDSNMNPVAVSVDEIQRVNKLHALKEAAKHLDMAAEHLDIARLKSELAFTQATYQSVLKEIKEIGYQNG